MRKTLAVLTLAIAGAGPTPVTVPPALAQSAMLAPGVYTTPEISRRCQDYTRARIPGGSGTMDTERQTVFLACVQRLSRDQQRGAPASAVPAEAPIVSAPVAMPYGGPYTLGGPIQGGCVTDEGYGRTASCDSL